MVNSVYDAKMREQIANMPDPVNTWPNVNFDGASVIVTGAGGFIGRRLVDGLISSNAHVTVLLRSGHDKAYFKARGANTLVCKLESDPDLENALAGNNLLFHFAYDVRASGKENLDAFSALYKAAKHSGIERIIHASSIVVYDDWPGGEIDESSPIGASGGGDYRQSKIAMEKILLEGNLPAAILQPTIVYGPDSSLWTNAPIAALKRGPVILPEPPGICPAVFVDDVVSGALLAGALPSLSRERFILNGPDKITWNDLFQAYATMIGTGTIELIPTEELKAKIPAPQATPSSQEGPSLAARISSGLRSMIGSRRFEALMSTLRDRLSSKGPVFPSSQQLVLYSSEPKINGISARDRLGYAPQYDLSKGIDAIAKSMT